uniref:protein cornichon homolog 1-like n=1 Tax=Myxine glutinosa TaxID=7769 RepID=UPI00358F8DEE
MAFSFATFCFMLALVLCSALIFFAIWHIAAFDELKREYKSPSEQGDALDKVSLHERVRKIERICRMLGKLVLPEYFIHSLFCVMFLCALEWLAVGVNAPLLCYHVWRYLRGPAVSTPGHYDPAEVLSTQVLAYCHKEGWCKLGFYLLSFFYYLYSMTYNLMSPA